MVHALVLLATLGSPLHAGDTIVELRRGDRVVIDNLSGEIVVDAWDRAALELRSDDRDPDLAVRRAGGSVEIVAANRRRRGRTDAMLRVPAWVSLDVQGRDLDISVSGVDGEIRLANVSGDIFVRDAGGYVDARSIAGKVIVENARGGVRASSQADDVTLRDVSGPVEVHSGSGDILLDEVATDALRAETQDGDIAFRGPIARGGSYGFFVHDGDASIALPMDLDALVSVSTFDGEFHSDFPVTVRRFTGGRAFEFQLGDGSARIEIEVFDGEIHLLRR